MRHVVVATHGHCFDGLCSAVMFTRLMRHIHPGEELSFAYHSMGYGPGQNGVDPAILTGQDNAILDYRFSTSPSLTWYFDHHVSAFPSEGDRTVYEAKAKQSSPTMFHDGTYGSCTKLIADVGRSLFGLDTSRDQSLIRWADMIDSASFPNAEMAVTRAEPVLQLMTVVEQYGDDAYLGAMVPRLSTATLEEVASSADVKKAYEPIAAEHGAYIERVREHARTVGHVVVVDLSSFVLEVAAKFVTYALWPSSAYSVMLSRSSTKCKLSIGYNPWSKVPRRHNIAQICERHGGGGHPVVGAVSLPVDQVDRARQLMDEIARELAG